jgi:S-(hydroxymethyl)glutathione dehydrogenase / alcohol dehydrogenase
MARAFRLAMEAVRPGGHVVFLGKVNVDQDVAFRWGSLMGEKQIVRSSYGGARPRRDFPWLAQLYLDGRLMLDESDHAAARAGGHQRGLRRHAPGARLRTVLEIAH